MKLALRRLRAAPVLTLTSIICLAVGVWMTCVVVAVGQGMFRPRLGVPSPDRLAYIDEYGLYSTVKGDLALDDGRVASKALVDTLAERKAFAAIGYYDRTYPQISPERIYRPGTILSSSMMDVLGVRTVLGRRFIPADDSSQSLLLSHHLWRSMFGGDSSVIGRRIELKRLNRRLTVTIVGVAAEGFAFPRAGQRVDMYLSAGNPKWFDKEPSREQLNRTALVRLRDDQTIADARVLIREIAMRSVAADREAMVQHWRTEYVRKRPPRLAHGPVNVSVERYHDEPFGRFFLKFVGLGLACGLAVVLIAAANVINLLLIRGTARRQEIAVRMALGASRSRIIRELIAETAILSTVGAMLGFAAARGQWGLMDRALPGRSFLGEIDWAMFPVALVAGTLLALLVGVWPGVRATSMSIEQVLRDTRRASVSASPLDNVLARLVIASTAATIMLLVCASLLSLSARGMLSDKLPPSERKGLVSLLTIEQSPGRAERARIALDAVAKVRGLTGVRFAVLGAPPGESEGVELHASVSGQARRLASVQLHDVSDGYVTAMNLRMLNGRGFTSAEARDSTDAVVISRSVASTLFGTTEATGRSFRYSIGNESAMVDATVVGVTENLPGNTRAQMYRPVGARGPMQVPLLVGIRDDGVSVRDISGAVRSVPGLLSSDLNSLEGRGGTNLRVIGYVLIGFSLFAVIGMLLAAVGTYGVVSYAVERRRHEIGVRLALGADSGRVTWMILEQGLKVTAMGIIVGLFLSYAATRVLSSVIFEVRRDYSISMFGVVVIVLGVSAIACLIPGYRAGKLNPVDALRSD